MLYLLAILIPPLALLLSGKPIQAILSFLLWVAAWFATFLFGAGFIMWLILAAHAVFVVRDRNLRKMIKDATNQQK